ncbi:MFS transporter [Sphingomonas changnyeongensis]|uniref:MFS transporter n=1 Tax=Sphingomonas changnyeongensis TaxID=2698679 RepID=A0A7Z2NVU9_9SPHN|nr:MFS transporter [Sphingomonas changnyeongensis]QHL90199.1 MFS transporter [Sphingomonas changnyeongensis]
MRTDMESADERALRRRGLTLGLLTLTYFFSYMDRQILAILMEPIRRDLDLTDLQLGLVAGFAFALFYATLGIPVARLADRGNRRNIVAVSLAVWSLFTALCGLAQNYAQLLAARIGVGIGEAGSSPPSHSMIADLYPPDRRAGAMAIYASGVVLGGGFGTILGGWLAHQYGWRTAIMAVGLPGLALAVIVRLLVVEPRRGLSEPARITSTTQPPLGEGFTTIWANPAARHLVMGVTLTSLVGYALTSFGLTYYIRSYNLDTATVGLVLGPLVAIVGTISGVGGGMIADRWARKAGQHVQSWLVAILKTAAMPFMALVYLAPSFPVAVAAQAVSVLLQSSYLGPSFALIQGLAPIRLRAMWAAITLLVINLIGLGLGPAVTGALSDLYRPYFGTESLRYALLTMAAITPWPIWHYWRAGQILKQIEAGADAAGRTGD